MADAPERIWAYHAPELEEDNPGCTIIAGESEMEFSQEYIRADLVEAIEAERDQALARLAAAHRQAIERCAALLIELGYVCESGETLAHEVRGLRVDPDAQAALDKLLAEARLEGWRAGRDAAAIAARGEGEGEWFNPVQAIRALPEPKEASHD